MTDTIEKKYNGIVIFGEMGSGKDTLADYLCTSDSRCCKYNLGDVVRQFYKVVKVNPIHNGNTRGFGQKVSDSLRSISMCLLNDYTLGLIYEKYEDILDLKPLVESTDELKKSLFSISSMEIPIIVGGRNDNDFEYWTDLNFLSVGITSNRNDRVDRLTNRDGHAPINNSTFKHNTESGVTNIINNKVDFIIHNNKDLEHLFNDADGVFKCFFN